MPSFDAIGLVATDLARTLDFYRLVGLDIADDAPTEGHVEFEVPGGLRIMFDTVEVIRSFSDWTEPSGSRPVTLAFKCDSPADVDETWKRLTDEGHVSKHEPFDAFWGQRYATVLDPDGNPVDLFAAL